MGVYSVMAVTRQDVTQTVKALGIQAGDTVLVHSSMKSFGYVEGGPEAVIGGFLDAIGEEGTLVMPTLIQQDFRNAYRDWHMDRPSDVGLITEVFRKMPGVLRSDQATHSVAAIGPKAEWITEGHTAFGPRFGPVGDYAFSYSSPWQKLYDMNAKIVFVGVGTRKNTMKHLVEHEVIEARQKAIEGRPGGEELKNQIRHFGTNPEGVWPYLDAVKMQEQFEQAGLLRHAHCQSSEFLCIEAKVSSDFTRKKMEEELTEWYTEPMQEWLLKAKEVAEN